jgi:hypothetical protein
VKNIRLVMSALAAAAALTATSGLAVEAQEASAQTVSAHGVNWGDVTIPGRLCKVSGQIRLHNGSASVRHSGFGIPLDVYTTTVARGDLAPSLPVTTLQIFCANTGGTADGQLTEGIFVFDSPGGHAHLLGTLTPQLKGNPMLHIPYIAVSHIESSGHVAVTEYFYNPVDPTCCPSGRATTLWKWTGSKFVPGRTKITSK